MKLFKKVALLALVATMVVGAMQTVFAAGSTHVLEGSKLTAGGEGAWADGDKVAVDDYFTLYMSAKAKIDSNSKTWDDGYTSEQRINFGGKADVSTPKNVIAFTTKGAASVKIWWVEAGDDHREMVILKADGTEVAKSTEGAAAEKNGLTFSTLSIGEAGTYFLGGDTGKNYIFKVEVTESATDSEVPKTGVVSSVAIMSVVALAGAGVAVVTRKKED